MYTNRIKLILIVLTATVVNSCIDYEAAFPESNAENNFELLWKIIDEKYCYMVEKDIDWDAIGSKYRSELNSNMNDVELFNLMSRMLNELEDGHVNLTSAFNRSRYWDWFLDYPPNFNATILQRDYLGKNYLIVGSLSVKRFNNAGYIRYPSFSNPISESNIRNAVSMLQPMAGLIIDIRDNGGGLIMNAEKFASCFIEEDLHVGYTRYKMGPGHSDFSPYYEKTLTATDSIVYDGPIILLTNRMVYSSANLFTTYMRALPQVTIIGDVTGGGGGVPTSSELYNGWSVRFSTNPMYNSRKDDIEFGIEPHIREDIDETDEINGVDTILEEAIKLISGEYYAKDRI